MNGMKKVMVISFITATVFLAVLSCRRNAVHSIKDLSDNMMDMKIYQENLGDEIRAGNMETAEWLATGLDSVLALLGETFPEHRKLSKPFSYFYKKDFSRPMRSIKTAIRKNDTATAIKHYKILVRKCDGCHIDHDVDEAVFE